MEIDDIDLTSRPQEEQVPQQNPIESVTEILQKPICKDSIPKEFLKKMLDYKKSERKKLLKKRKKAKESLTYWVSKKSFLDYQLNQNSKEIENLKCEVE